MVQGQNPSGQQQAPRQAEQEELDRRLGPLGASPERNHAIRGNHRDFPEEEKEKGVQGGEHAHHGPFRQEDEHHEGLHVRRDAAPGAQDAQGDEKRGEQDQRQADTVHTHRVLGAEGQYPLHAVHELRPAGRVVKARPQPHREPQREQGDAEGHPANGLSWRPWRTRSPTMTSPMSGVSTIQLTRWGIPNKLAGFSMLTLR